MQCINFQGITVTFVFILLFFLSRGLVTFLSILFYRIDRKVSFFQGRKFPKFGCDRKVSFFQGRKFPKFGCDRKVSFFRKSNKTKKKIFSNFFFLMQCINFQGITVTFVFILLFFLSRPFTLFLFQIKIIQRINYKENTLTPCSSGSRRDDVSVF
jgi:hypothetical protein